MADPMRLEGRTAVVTGAAGGIGRRQSRILVGSDAKTISLIARLMPASYWKVLSRRMNTK